MDTVLQRIRKLFRPIQTLLIEYCDNSNIHGVRYLSEKCLHWSERLWWIIALCASLGVCGSAAINIWIEWRANPTTFSYTEQPVSISKIPFPTITICPEIKIDKSQFDLRAALNSLSNLNEIERMHLDAFAHICPRLHGVIKSEEKFADDSLYRVLFAAARRIQRIFLNFFDYIVNYGRIVPILTEEGICFVYNALNSHEMYTDEMDPKLMIVTANRNASNWSLEKGFQDESISNYPIRSNHGGKLSGILFELQVLEEDFEYDCGRSNQGFKVIVSTPGDVIKSSRNSHRVPLAELTQISIKPTLTITSEGLRKYSPHQRQCYFDSERQLRFFRIYSKSNCEEECLTNFTKVECDCVKFPQPRDMQTKVCGVGKINCYKNAEKLLSSDDNSKAKELRDKCNCLPSCTSIEYEVDVARKRKNLKNIEKRIWHSSHHTAVPNSIQTASMHIFLKDAHVTILKRIESNTLTDYLAFCGGLLGVFMGISALSIVEIIYYLTIRLYIIIRPLHVSNAVVPFHQVSSNIFDRFRVVRGTWAFIVEFCDNSNIHGFVYFTRRGLHWIERLWWIIAFGVSIWLCTMMAQNVWQGWLENPVKMTFTRKPISDIPFPTVTICPEMLTNRHNLDLSGFNIRTENMSKLIRSFCDNDMFRTIVLICNHIQANRGNGAFLSFPQFEAENIYDILQDIGHRFEDVMHKCILQGKVVDCSKYIVPILTMDGVCFAFNALNSHEIYTDEMALGMMIVKNTPNVTNWSFESGFEIGTRENDYPLRIYDSGRRGALEISLDFFEEYFKSICKSHDEGFFVSLDDAVTMPGDELKSFFKLSLSDESVITLKPKLTTTSEGLRKYNPNHRKCFFQAERKLRFFKIYTQVNCKEECLANLTKRNCGCVRFSQPRDKDTKICGMGKMHCVNDVKSRLLWHQASNMAEERKYIERCNCLPSCTTIDYNPVIDRVKFDKKAVSLTAARNANVSGIQRARLVIHFEEQLIETEQREELYTIGDLFAICGGLLGLFMGISVLSIAEIVYFATLRWYWILRRPTSVN